MSGRCTTFKRIFDAYHTERPREFIEIVRANAGGSAAELESELMACSSPAPNAASARVMSAVESAATSQMLRAAEIRKTVA